MTDKFPRHLSSDTRPDRDQPLGPRSLRAPGLTILAHPDLSRAGERIALTQLPSGRSVELSRLTPLFSRPGSRERRPLADPHLSRQPLVLAPTADGAIRIDALGSPLRLTVDGNPVRGTLMLSQPAVARGAVMVLAGRVAVLLHEVDPAPPLGVPSHGLVGDSPAVVTVRREIDRVARLDMAVLLRGETGTGKELVARALHQASPRQGRPFVAVNMAAIPPSLAAAELLGVAKGAYTGADHRRQGYFERADGGTLFLDEIGEMPPDVQALLLRAIETGEIQAVGAERSAHVDVRVIAATDADLENAVIEGRFRAPLLHRLNGYEIHMPPLRERREDLGLLLVHFLTEEMEAIGEAHHLTDREPDDPVLLPAPLVGRLAAHGWPGNLRELRNVARRAAVHMASGSPLTEESLLGLHPGAQPLSSGGSQTVEPPSEDARARRRAFRPPGTVSETELLLALKANRWRLQPTAKALGVSRTSLYALIERSTGIRKASDVSRGEIEQCLAGCSGDVEALAERLQVPSPGLERRLRDLGLGLRTSERSP